MPEQWPTIFRNHVGIYDAFSRAEDEGNSIVERLLSMATVKGKRILEVGCGTGKHTELIAPGSRSYIAIDSSIGMIEFARRRCERVKEVRFAQCSAESLPLIDSSVNEVFAGWVISGITPWQARERAIHESLRVLKQDGHIWLFENDSGGEFMAMRDADSARWDKENVTWLMEKHGFSIAGRVQTAFRFRNIKEAKDVMSFVLGQSASDYLKRNPKLSIGHDVLILSKAKSMTKQSGP